MSDPNLEAEKAAHAADQEGMKLIVTLLRDFPLERYVERMKQARALAPFVDPTLFMKRGASLAIELEVAEVVLDAKVALNRIAARELPNLAKLAAADRGEAA